MGRRLAAFAVLVCAATETACSGPSAATPDAGAGVDAGVDGGESDAAPAVPDPEPAALPVFTPCPPGWRAVARSGPGEPETCDPWPAGGPTPCANDEMWAPGDPGCVRVGPACPVGDDFPVDLPVGGTIVFVKAGAIGGDGTRALPFATLPEAVAAAASTPGAVIAIARGRYELADFLDLPAPVTLQGACARETTIVAPIATSRPALRPRVSVTVRDLRFEGPPPVMFSNAADVVLRSLVIDDVNGMAFAITMGTLDAQDIVVHGGSTAFFLNRSSATMRRISIEHTRSTPIVAAESDVLVTDCVVRDAGEKPGPLFMLESSVGATLRLERTVLDRGFSFGALVADASRLELVDAVVTGAAREDVSAEDGFFVLGGSTARFERVRVSAARSYAFLVAEPASHADFTDVMVTDVFGITLPDGEARSGEALSVEDGASVTVTRMLASHATAVGILVSGVGAVADLRDVTVRDTEPLPTTRAWGRGVQVQLGASVTGARVLLERNREASLFSSGVGTTVVLTDVDVQDTLERACAATTCMGAGGGTGVGAFERGALRLERFRIEASALTGAQLARLGEMDLRDGQILANPIGVNVQVPDYDFTRISTLVLFRDNGTNLDSRDLPVPSADTSGL